MYSELQIVKEIRTICEVEILRLADTKTLLAQSSELQGSTIQVDMSSKEAQDSFKRIKTALAYLGSCLGSRLSEGLHFDDNVLQVVCWRLDQCAEQSFIRREKLFNRFPYASDGIPSFYEALFGQHLRNKVSCEAIKPLGKYRGKHSRDLKRFPVRHGTDIHHA